MTFDLIFGMFIASRGESYYVVWMTNLQPQELIYLVLWIVNSDSFFSCFFLGLIFEHIAVVQ